MTSEKNDTYYFHQTPTELCKELMKHIDYQDGDVLLEPFRGTGAFFNNFPTTTTNHWCELTDGICYTSYTGTPDWVITNPPFRLETGTKRVNSFFFLLNYFMGRTTKGIGFLANHSCWATFTPKRIAEFQQNGWTIDKVVVCSVKKWSGRYYFIIFRKNKLGSF